MTAGQVSPASEGGAIPDKNVEALFAGWGGFGHIALAVSGGADSTALLLLVHSWLARCAPPLPCITVLTVDHGLRAASAAEAEWVEALSSHLGFTHRTLNWTGEKPHTGIQAAARTARYALMARACREAGIDALATAHNADDQAETLLMRLARGSGVDGLASMPETSRLDGIALLRPLLGLKHTILEEYLRERGQDWIEDPSNRDETFERVRVRRALRKGTPPRLAVENLALSARRLRRARQALEAATADFLRGALEVHDAGFGRIAVTALMAAPEEIALRALARACSLFGRRRVPPRLSALEALHSALASGSRDATLGGCAFAVRRGQLRITREAGRMSQSPRTIHPGETTLWDGRLTVTLPPDAPAGLTLRPLGTDGLAALRALGGSLDDVPHAAALTLPSLWQDNSLCFTPFATWAERPPARWLAGAAARFEKLGRTAT